MLLFDAPEDPFCGRENGLPLTGLTPISISARATVPKFGMKIRFPNVLTPGIGIGPMLLTSEHCTLELPLSAPLPLARFLRLLMLVILESYSLTRSFGRPLVLAMP